MIWTFQKNLLFRILLTIYSNYKYGYDKNIARIDLRTVERCPFTVINESKHGITCDSPNQSFIFTADLFCTNANSEIASKKLNDRQQVADILTYKITQAWWKPHRQTGVLSQVFCSCMTVNI